MITKKTFINNKLCKSKKIKIKIVYGAGTAWSRFFSWSLSRLRDLPTSGAAQKREGSATLILVPGSQQDLPVQM